VKEAILNHDTDYIKDLARKQAEEGADYLDVNVATGQDWEQEVKDMEWIVQEVQSVVEKPLSIDTADYRVMEAGLKVHQGQPILNSASAEPGRQDPMLELAAKYDGRVVVLPVQENIPETAAERLKLCESLFKKAQEYKIDSEKLYFDALVLPLSVNHKNPSITLETIRLIKEQQWQTTVGLSNVSYGLPNRGILNRSFLNSAMTMGLDSVFLNPLHKGTMAAFLATQAILGRDQMCMNYLKAYREGKFS